MNNSKNEKNLEMLLQFCQQSKVVGWISNMWYSGLANSYPCHFLIFTQNSEGKNWRKEQSKKRIKERINNRIEKVLSMPLEKNDGELYEFFINSLDKMIDEREKKLKI